MSAQYAAPGLGRAQTATPAFLTAQQGSSTSTGVRHTRLTRRALAVTAATLCAPLVAAVGLVGFAAAGGGSQAEMGTMTGAQGLRGTTVAATSAAPKQVSEPAAEATTGFRKDDASAPSSNSQGAPAALDGPQHQPAPPTREPSGKPPTHAAPKPPPSPRVRAPAPAPSPTAGPSEPGAPVTTGGTDSSGSSGGPGYPDGRDGGSGGD
jgi:hypothetical protein